jgi:dTDP-4-amino-4,6-dideoxygalactose transaminase
VLPFIRPVFPRPEQWLPFLQASYAEGRFSNFGPCHQRLEQTLTERFGDGRREAVLVSSGTTGITAALLAYGIVGDVAVPAFTFPATALAVIAAGCTPVFCDVDPYTWELSPRELEALANRRRLAAAVHVRAFGLCRDATAVQGVTTAARIPLIIDSAAALGGNLDNGQPVALQGDAEVFSLHATKVFAIGEGGVVFVPPETATKLRQTINFGMAAGTVVRNGCNGKLSELAAAVGLAMAANVDQHIARRRRIAEQYTARFGGDPRLGLPVAPGAAPWQTFPVRLLRNASATAMEALVGNCREAGVELRRYYCPALHRTPFLGRLPAAGRCPVAEALSDSMLCLPIYSDMSESEQDIVGDVFSAALEGEARLASDRRRK